ncbi:MAG: hypothetical protein HWE16_17350 [Gammaproteobacteria bacterium]|nr:hypothetical protein [Gammaproteobacteria bacterium]
MIDNIYRNYRHIYDEHVDSSVPQLNIIMPFSMVGGFILGGEYKDILEQKDHKYPRRLRLTYIFTIISFLAMGFYSVVI